MTNDNLSIRLKELSEPFQDFVQNLEQDLAETNLKAKVVRSLVNSLINGDLKVVKDTTSIDGIKLVIPQYLNRSGIPLEIKGLVATNIDLIENVLEIIDHQSSLISSTQDSISPPEQYKLHCISVTTLLEKILQYLGYTIQNWSKPAVDKQNVIDYVRIAYENTTPKYVDKVFSTQEAISCTPPPGGLEVQAYSYVQCLRSLIEILYSKIVLLIMSEEVSDIDKLALDFAVALIYTAMKKDLLS